MAEKHTVKGSTLRKLERHVQFLEFIVKEAQGELVIALAALHAAKKASEQ